MTSMEKFYVTWLRLTLREKVGFVAVLTLADVIAELLVDAAWWLWALR